MSAGLKHRGMHYLRRRDLSTDRERTHAYMRVALLVLALVILWAVIIAAAVTIYTTLF